MNTKFKGIFQGGVLSTLPIFLSVVVLGVTWQLLSGLVGSELILPTPAAVFARVLLLMEDPQFWSALLGSLGRALVGFSIAACAATVLGIVSGLFRPFQLFLYPMMQLLRAIPVMSIILYLLLFVDSDWVAIWVSVLIVFPIIYTNMVTGFRSVDGKLLEMAKLYKVPFSKQLGGIYLPALFPYWIAGCLTGMGLNVKALITAEAMSLPQNSFGMFMIEARNYLDTEGVLAVTVWIILLALVLDLVLLGVQWLVLSGRRAYVVKFKRRRA